MSGSQHPLFTTPQVMPAGQMVGGGQMPSSPLAAALMHGGAPVNLPPPSLGVSPMGLASLMKGTNPYGNPNGGPSVGANATPEQMSAMLNAMPNGQIPQMGQPGAPIGPAAAGPSWMDQMGQWLSNMRMGGGGQ